MQWDRETVASVDQRLPQQQGMMKSYALLGLSFATIFFLLACGGADSAPTTASPSTPASTPTAASPVTSEEGTLEIRVTDQPSDGVTSILVTVSNIEVNVSGDSEDAGWRTVIAQPRRFDLVKLRGVEEILGKATLEPGRYEQLRLEVTEVVLTIRGNVRIAKVPSKKLRLVGGFQLMAGATTVLTLDFDAEKSIVFRPGVGPQLKPVVKLLARTESQSLAEARTVATLGEEVAPSPTDVPAPSSASAVRVALPVADNLQWMNFYVVQGAGFFEDEGIDVQIVVPPMPDAAARFMVMGGADVALLPRPLYLESIGRGEPVVIFANLFSNDPINLVVRQEVAEERGISADMPLAERLNGMRGLRVGVAPGPPTRLRVLFESVGLDADSDIEMVIVNGDQQNEAFGKNEVDALYAHTPYLERSLLKQGAVMIVNQSAGEVPELTNRQIHTLVTTLEYAGSNPQVLAAMTNAVYRAQQLIHSDLQATADAIRSSEVQLREPEGLDTIIAIYEPAIPQTPEVSVEGALRELGSFFPAHRTPPDLSGVDLKNHIDNQFAEQAIALSMMSAAATITTSEHGQLGTILVGANGNTLYVFTRDEPNKSNCSGRCAQTWPPHVTVGEPTAGEGITAGMLGTITREDGSTQVTYSGHPLYRFANDEKPGDTNGQGQGGAWFVISPAGNPITAN